MSIKINALIPAAAAAAGIATPTAAPVAEPLLATLAITAIHCSEITDGSGKFLTFVKIGTDTRAVAGTDGNVKLYSNAAAALKFAKAANLNGSLNFVLYEKTAAVGDPLASLDARYKQACVKGFAAQSKQQALHDKISIAKQFGWDVSTGATLAEYNDLVARVAVLTEWESEALALVDTLGERLRSVGVDPTTLGPRPTPADPTDPIDNTD